MRTNSPDVPPTPPTTLTVVDDDVRPSLPLGVVL